MVNVKGGMSGNVSSSICKVTCAICGYCKVWHCADNMVEIKCSECGGKTTRKATNDYVKLGANAAEINKEKYVLDFLLEKDNRNKSPEALKKLINKQSEMNINIYTIKKMLAIAKATKP